MPEDIVLEVVQSTTDPDRISLRLWYVGPGGSIRDAIKASGYKIGDRVKLTPFPEDVRSGLDPERSDV